MTLAPGTRLAHYEIVSPLDSGGMGVVYRGRDPRLDRDVAIKVLSDRLASDPDMRARFEQEARSLAALSHPNILAIHELAVFEGLPVAVMELLTGENLRARLSRGPLSWRDAVSIAAAVADGLAAAHARGIVHRDLKPDNVFLTAQQQVKILDFGLAHRTIPVAASDSPTVVRTRPGLILGAIGYLAPEQIQGHELDGRADIFALGCMLFEMVARRRPFDGATPDEALAATLRAPMPPLEPSEPAPPGLERILAHCLDKRPERRFASAADLASALRALLQDSAGSPSAFRRRGRPHVNSIAVLPFFNTGIDPNAEYLSDGITESIINNLSQLPKLRVVPRSTVFRYRGREVDLETIGLALNVRTFLTGRVTQLGDWLSVQAELVDARSEAQLWGQQFRIKPSDIFAVQEEIAWQISEALRLNERYLRGLYHWNRWTPEDFRKSVTFFEQAVAADPGYALAHSGVAQALTALSFYGHVPPEEGFPQARAAAEKAISLDPDVAMAYVSLALVRFFFDWDWKKAEAAFRKALALDRQLGAAHAFYALFLNAAGRHEESLEEATEGQRLDPLSLIINSARTWPLFALGRYEEALAQVEQVLDLDPGFPESHSQLIGIYEELGRYGDAAAAFARHPAIGGRADIGAHLAGAVRAGGADGYWRAKLEVIESTGPVVSPYLRAICHAALGEQPQALDALERACEERSGYILFVKTEPRLHSLAGHPRFQALLQRVGFP